MISSGIVSQRCILITGMHRSGTSMHAGLIEILGADLGKTLGPKPGVNDKGFFEHKQIMRNNQYLLESMKMSWDSVAPLPSNWIERATRFKSQALNLVKESFGGSSLFCIKDPRICRTLKMWMPLLDELNVDTSVILCVRHPEDVYLSLNKRSKISRKKAMRLWKIHYQDFLRDIDRPYIVVRYNNTTADPLGYLYKIADFVGLQDAASLVTEETKEFVSSDLKHNDVGGNILDEEIDCIYKQLIAEAL